MFPKRHKNSLLFFILFCLLGDSTAWTSESSIANICGPYIKNTEGTVTPTECVLCKKSISGFISNIQSLIKGTTEYDLKKYLSMASQFTLDPKLKDKQLNQLIKAMDSVLLKTPEGQSILTCYHSKYSAQEIEKAKKLMKTFF